MSEPYASVVLPTHTRAETLPIALAAVCAQTVHDLEVLVVLDGATPACRRVATAAASRDTRIRVLDLPKAPHSGKENLDRAIASARGSRVFYTDDDDVWTPDHVASLGPHLDDADVVDCPTVSLGLTGRLHVAPMTVGAARMRQLLVEYRYKCVFDVHLAHRREICGREGGQRWAREGAPADRPVWGFLAGLAADEALTWVSCPRPTSLSVHGASRREADPHERSAELALWAQRIARAEDWREAIRTADYCHHAATLLAADPPAVDGRRSNFEEYFLDHGFAVADMEEPERDRLRALHALACGQRVSRAAVESLVDRISCPVIYAQSFPEAYGRIVPPFTAEEAVNLLRSAADRATFNPAGCWGALAMALAATGAASEAIAAVDRAIEIGPDPHGALSTLRARLVQARCP